MTSSVQPPLDVLSNDELWNNQLLLAIQCGGGAYSFRRRNVRAVCALANALQLEAARRGVPSPQKPYSISKLKLIA